MNQNGTQKTFTISLEVWIKLTKSIDIEKEFFTLILGQKNNFSFSQSFTQSIDSEIENDNSFELKRYSQNLNNGKWILVNYEIETETSSNPYIKIKTYFENLLINEMTKQLIRNSFNDFSKLYLVFGTKNILEKFCNR
jgi:hypothetical protein